MANFEIDVTQEVLETALRKIETGDPVHADVYNALFQVLINNDAFLDRLANRMIQQTMIAHVLDSINPNMVLGADQGPVIMEQIRELNSDLKNYLSINSMTPANAISYIGKTHDIAINESAILTGIGIVGYGYFYNRYNGAYNLQHYFDMQNQCIYERLLVSAIDKEWSKLTKASDLDNRMIFEFVPIMTDEDVKAYYNALPINTIRYDYNYNGKEYTYIFSKSTNQNGNVMRIASSGGTLETRSIINGTWSDWIAK